MGSSSRSPVGDGPASPKYSDRLSPAINNYLSEASRQEVRVSLYYCSHIRNQLSTVFVIHLLRRRVTIYSSISHLGLANLIFYNLSIAFPIGP